MQLNPCWPRVSTNSSDDVLDQQSSMKDTRYVQPFHSRPYKRRSPYDMGATIYMMGILFNLLVSRCQAAFIPFDNCLDPAIVNSSPLQLQWIPLWLSANFNSTATSHNLNVTTYGNVSGQAVEGPYPPPNDPSWKDPKSTFGKILNVSATNNMYSTLYSKYQVLTYTAYDAAASEFCSSTINTTCPIAPAFFADRSNPYDLPAFSVAHDFYSAYSFASFQTTIRVVSGDAGAPDLACVSAVITPNLGDRLSAVLTYIPMVVLVFMAISTFAAAVFSPWGSLDPFRWTSNYGRDEDLLRLVTPGFGDCLQYLQFIVLAGSLSLSYPGYFQPVVSKVGWAALMFNESFVSGGPGLQNPVDGIYVTNGTYGLRRMGELVGMKAEKDMWAGMVIWTLVIMAAVILLCQLGFAIRYTSRFIKKTPEEDLRKKNWPFTAGNMVRIVCSYFLLPIVAFSMFQLVVTAASPAVLTGLAVVLLVAIICFAGWVLRIIFSTKHRSLLFDDLPTVLLYGPLYNTYLDDAAPFALIPALLTFIRGIAIGAVQPSGIAQLVILAICEVILVLTLNAFRPFHSPTSMNAYHTFFATVRLVIVLLKVAFVPSLGVTEAPKGWIGYVILLLHAIVLVFGFFLNAIQTLIEVIARRAGAGGEDGGVASRGGLVRVFGMRQLSRRAKRTGLRSSLNSDAVLFPVDDDFKSFQNGNRSRSLSASSAILLNQRGSSDPRLSSHLDQGSSVEDAETPREAKTYSFLPSEIGSNTAYSKPALGIKTAVEPTDPYYRAPRARRPTGDTVNPGAKSRGSWASADVMRAQDDINLADQPTNRDSMPPRSFTPSQGNLVPAYLRNREDADSILNDPRRSQVDYAVREVDFYYGVRGPALNAQPTRKLKTGPADPVGPVSSATGWFKGMFGRKTKDKGKGFEVVRSSRAPQGFDVDEEAPAQTLVNRTSQQPYRDSPEPQLDVVLPGQRTRSTDLDRGDGFYENDGAPSPLNSEDERDLGDRISRKRQSRSQTPNFLGVDIDTGSDIKLPSRFGSKTSDKASQYDPSDADPPPLPYKSLKRISTSEVNLLQDPPGVTSPEKWTRQSLGRRRSSGALPSSHTGPQPVIAWPSAPAQHISPERESIDSGGVSLPSQQDINERHFSRNSLDSHVSADNNVMSRQSSEPKNSKNWPLR